MKYIFVLFFLSISFSFGQNINYEINKTILKEYLLLEEKTGSELFYSNSRYYSSNGDAQPIEYLRKETLIPNLKVYYFFKEKDSVMSYVLYEWDVNNFEDGDNNKKSESFQKALIQKYQDLKKDISNKFGEPVVKKNYSNISRLDPENVFEENSKWNSNENIEIELYSTVSNFYKKEGFMTINPVHRIRLYIRNLNIK